MSKIAIFGGTFDPIHNGHIAMAKYAVESLKMDRVIFLPNGNPPHKKEVDVTDAFYRYNMVKIAVERYDFFSVSDYETKNNDYSYSLYTMRHFRRKYGKDVYFIIGADSLCTIHQWHEYEKLLTENKFIVFFRDTEADDEFLNTVEKYRKIGADITTAHMPKINISSTDVRLKLSEGSYNGLPVDKNVFDYIIKNKLYGG